MQQQVKFLVDQKTALRICVFFSLTHAGLGSSVSCIANSICHNVELPEFLAEAPNMMCCIRSRVGSGGGGGGGGLRGLKPPPPSKLMRCVTYILVKILTLILQKKTLLHESAHEERQISIPETTYFSHQN